ncbi:MAG: WD40 repeat domain-containing protein [Hydrococcus sp. Prado102]|nr:WD40 repeat domain-containing protein [Hydrococcus sp. Prado102]
MERKFLIALFAGASLVAALIVPPLTSRAIAQGAAAKPIATSLNLLHKSPNLIPKQTKDRVGGKDEWKFSPFPFTRSPFPFTQSPLTPIAQSGGRQTPIGELTFTGVVTSIAISPDGQTLVVATGDGKITAIALDDLQQIYTESFAGKLDAVAISADGEIIAAAIGEEIVLLRLEDGDRIGTLRGHVSDISAIAMAPDNQTLVSVSSSDRTIRLWDLEDESEIEVLGENVGLEITVAYSPDGQFFVTGSIAEDRTIKLWDAKTPQWLKTSPQQPGFIYDIAITPDGRKIVAAVRNFLKVWDFEGGEELLSVKSAQLDLNAIAISPDSRTVAIATKEGTIKLWNIATGQLLQTLSGHRGWVLSLAFSPDGRYLYSGAEDKTVKIWQIAP